MYNLIYDENELYKYFDRIMPELKLNEVFFVSLSARNKYITKEEQQSIGLGRTEMFARKIVREKDWNKFLRTIRRFETNEGSYLSKTKNMSIPQKCITVYVNINPSCVLKAYKEFQTIYTDYLYELSECVVKGHKIENIMNRIKMIDHTLMTCIQKNRGSKYWLDIDFDVPKDIFNAPVLMEDYLETKELVYHWISTHSGYHLLIDRSTIKFNPQDICKYGNDRFRSLLFTDFRMTWDEDHTYITDNNGVETKYEIIQNKNEMVPLCGCIQGGHKVKFI